MKAPVIVLIVFLAMLSYYLSIAEPAPEMSDRYYPSSEQSKCSGNGPLANFRCTMRDITKEMKASTQEIEN